MAAFLVLTTRGAAADDTSAPAGVAPTATAAGVASGHAAVPDHEQEPGRHEALTPSRPAHSTGTDTGD
ncbi:hypothetical protein ABZZ80_09825 [Streptomyces sp. NPDC006356]